MKNRKLRSFLYSLLLHGMIALSVVALFVMQKSEEKVTEEKRYKVMLTQVNERLPQKAEPRPPVVKKEKKPKPEKKVVKKKPVKKKLVKKIEKKKPVKKVPVKKVVEPVVEESVVVQETFEPVEEVIEKKVEEVVAAEERKELIVTPDEPVALSPAAKEAIEAPPAENITPEDAYVKAHITEIMSLLRKNLYYPRMARKRGIEGKVMVRFELLKNGDIRNITVIEAGRDILARAAVTTIERLKGKFPLPDEVLILNVPIMYQLK